MTITILGIEQSFCINIRTYRGVQRDSTSNQLFALETARRETLPAAVPGRGVFYKWEVLTLRSSIQSISAWRVAWLNGASFGYGPEPICPPKSTRSHRAPATRGRHPSQGLD